VATAQGRRPFHDNESGPLQMPHDPIGRNGKAKGVSEERAITTPTFTMRDVGEPELRWRPSPHRWFEKPGDQPAYSEADLEERLLTRDMLQPGKFHTMLKERGRLIQERALALFKMDSVAGANTLFDIPTEV
jgi:hypothetical protein